MTPQLLFIIILVPILITLALKVNAGILFMSLCVGEVLVQFMASDANSMLSLFSVHQNSLSASSIRLILLFIPPILTLLFMFHSVRGTIKSAINVIPAIGLGLATALFVEPLLSLDYQHKLQKSSLWHQLIQAQALVIGVTALLSLVFLLSQKHGSIKSKHHGRPSKHHG
jgi:hypothetical protein